MTPDDLDRMVHKLGEYHDEHGVTSLRRARIAIVRDMVRSTWEVERAEQLAAAQPTLCPHCGRPVDAEGCPDHMDPRTLERAAS